jgi:hypothetical protein
VAFLQQGLCHEASSFLFQAIQLFTDSIEAEQNQRPLPLQRNDGAPSRGRPRSSVHVAPTNILDQVCTYLQLSFSPGNAFQFFNKSFLIDVVSDVNNNYSAAAKDQMVAAVQWYNWGVTYHYAAISRGLSKYLAKAHTLYTKAFRILLQNGNAINHSLVLLMLAVSNNMAYCSYHIGDVKAARGCHDYIRNVLETYGYSSFDQEEYECFFSPWSTRAVMSIAPAA